MARLVVPLALLFLLVLSGPVMAAESDPPGGVLLRLDGDVVIGPNETVGTLILVGEDSTLRIEGNATVVIVVGGSLQHHGVIREQLVLVNARATLHNGSLVQGDIASSTSTLDIRDGAEVDGAIEEGTLVRIAPAAFVAFGVIFFVGVPVAFLVLGLAAVGLFPHQVRTVGLTLHRDFRGTLVTALFLWVALPLAAFVALLTLVGVPLALGIFFLLLPVLWVAGFIATGIRVGDAILTLGRPVQHGHPYAAAVVGILTLLVIALLPFIGGLVFFLAGALGSAALVLASFRAVRGGRGPPRFRRSPWDPGAGGS